MKKIILGASIIILILIIFLAYFFLPPYLLSLRKEAYYPLKASKDYSWQLVRQTRSSQLLEAHTAIHPLHSLVELGGTLYGAGEGGLLALVGTASQEYNVLDGLPSHKLTSLANYNEELWLATKGQGLIQKKGQDFLLYKSPKKAQNNINALAVYAGHLFIGTNAGLVRFNGKSWQQYGLNAGLPSEEILAMTCDGEALWLMTKEKLVRYNNHLFEVLDYPTKALVTSLASHAGQIWLGTTNGLYAYDGRLWKEETPPRGIKGKHISALAANEQVLCLASYSGGVLERRGAKWAQLADRAQVTALYLTSSQLYIASKQGLEKLGANALTLPLASTRGPASNQVTSLALWQDKLWLGTFRDGLSSLDLGGWRNYALETPLEINQILVVKDGFYAATTRGLLKSSPSGWQTLLPHIAINGLAFDGYKLWLASADGLLEYDGLRLKTWGLAEGLLSNRVYAVHWDGQALWIGTLAGLSCLKEGQISSFSKASGELPNNWVVALASNQGKVWVGTYGGGVSSFDGQTWQKYGALEGLEALEVNPHALLAWQEGVLVGTLEGGLYYIEEDQLRRIQREFPSENITAILSWGQEIWLGSDSGLWSFKWEG